MLYNITTDRMPKNTSIEDWATNKVCCTLKEYENNVKDFFQEVNGIGLQFNPITARLVYSEFLNRSIITKNARLNPELLSYVDWHYVKSFIVFDIFNAYVPDRRSTDPQR